MGPAEEGKLALLPRYHVFGSEELSSLSPAIAARTAPASVVLSRTECEKRGLKEGDKARIEVDGAEVAVLAVLVREIPEGIATVALGLPGMPMVSLPCQASLSAVPVTAESTRVGS
jgi:NADH-quinone oxidoreductase subunit G